MLWKTMLPVSYLLISFVTIVCRNNAAKLTFCYKTKGFQDYKNSVRQCGISLLLFLLFVTASQSHSQLVSHTFAFDGKQVFKTKFFVGFTHNIFINRLYYLTALVILNK